LGSPTSGTASRTSATPTSCVDCGSRREAITFGEQESIAAGVSAGGLVVSIDNRTATCANFLLIAVCSDWCIVGHDHR
jgi:hypothetical protein